MDNSSGNAGVGEHNFWAQLASEQAVDGLLFVEKSLKYDFKMRYLNADGKEAEMCGNGIRAIAHFVYNELGQTPIKEKIFNIETKNGLYQVESEGLFKVKMNEISQKNFIDISDFSSQIPGFISSYYVRTGVPHCVFQVTSVDNIDINKVAAPIRHDKRFAEGVNINFIEVTGSSMAKIRTFERGVEGETLSCGTGATAAALALRHFNPKLNGLCLSARGGELFVDFNFEDNTAYLSGKVEQLSKGLVEIGVKKS